MPSFSFTIPGEPKAKGRARHVPLFMCRRCGRKGMRKQCRCGSTEMDYMTAIPYTPAATETYEGIVRTFAMDAMRSAGVEQPIVKGVSLVVGAHFSIPQSRACRLTHKPVKTWVTPCTAVLGGLDTSGCKKLHDGDAHSQRPDLDNVLKSIADGCNKVVWADDASVWHILASKYWGTPRVEVTVSW